MARILIIDDDELLCQMLIRKIGKMGHDALAAHSAADGIETVQTLAPEVVYLDVMLPDGDGLDLLPRIRQSPSSPEVIIFTARGTTDGAELAIKSGAWDYIPKPNSLTGMILPMTRALEYRAKRLESQTGPVALKRSGIVGNSLPMEQCLDMVAKAAQSEANVLINGETGTGKELIASAIHRNSKRADAEFVAIDCTALPENLAANQLFGHRRGAFTGADCNWEGLIRRANRGTLFLDEVGELTPDVQKVFLRVLQEGRFTPLGTAQEVACDFRVVAATNRDLASMAADGTFRKDLLFRLRGMEITLPPLRSRGDDIMDLTHHYLADMADRQGKAIKGLSPDFMTTLRNYQWPGNVRELINALCQSVATAGNSPILFPQHLPHYIRVEMVKATLKPAVVQVHPSTENTCAPENHVGPLPKLKVLREEAERQYLKDLVSASAGDIGRACRISGVSRSRLYALLKKYNIRL